MAALRSAWQFSNHARQQSACVCLLGPGWVVLHVHGHGLFGGGFSAWFLWVGGWAAHTPSQRLLSVS